MILDIAISDLDSYFGNALAPLIGSNLLLAGGIILILYMVLAFKLHLGVEATLILGAFLIMGLVAGFGGVILSGLLPSVVGSAAGLVVGIILYLGWRAIKG